MGDSENQQFFSRIKKQVNKTKIKEIQQSSVKKEYILI